MLRLFHEKDDHIFIKTLLEFQLKQMRAQIRGEKVHYLSQLIIFRWGNYLYVSLFLSVHLSLCLSVHRALYHRKCASSDYNFWYTCVKLWYLQVFLSFFFNFDFLGCSRGKRAKDSPKWKITITSVTCHVSGTV